MSYWSENIAGLYCERLVPGIWGEPLNAISSLFLIVVLGLSIGVLRRYRPLPVVVVVLIGLAFAIGVGSFLLHTVATRWAEYADVLPIWGFVAVYASAARHAFGRPELRSPRLLPGALLLFGVGTAISVTDSIVVSDGMSGSSQYIPALLVMTYIIGFIYRQNHPSFYRILGGVGLFMLALFFRSIDMPLCTRWGHGTHFLWHIFNCAAFGVFLREILLCELAERREPRGTASRETSRPTRVGFGLERRISNP